MPRFTITEVPIDMTDEVLVTKICVQDAFLSSEINNNITFLVKKSWTSKRYCGTPNFMNVMIKCSPQIRKHIIKEYDGYVYVGLTRCKSFDHYSCYYCFNFNHFARECPYKDMPATCDKCAERHKTKDCNRNSLVKSVNCVQNRDRNVKHSAFSRKCPAMVKLGLQL